MPKEMAGSEIEEFLDGPLVAWFSGCLEAPLNSEKLTYERLIDGVLLQHVFLKMDLHCRDGEVVPSLGEPSLRARNLSKILGNIRQFYEQELNHILVRLPDVARLSREPQLHVSEAELLLSLLLGCAVKCPSNERFIGDILKLDETSQAAIAERIAQVLHVPGVMLSQELLVENAGKAFELVRRICRERDYYRIKLKSILALGGQREPASTASTASPTTIELSPEEEELEALSSSELDCSLGSSERKEAELLLEARSQLRRQQEELKERCEELHEARDELQACQAMLLKIQRENERLVSEVRSSKSYRDELDAANEKAERADRLEQEIARYKEKLAEAEFCKSRLKELREDNRLLLESKDLLSEQLASCRAKAERLGELEQRLLQLGHQAEELGLEHAASRDKCRQLCEENARLERLLREKGLAADAEASAEDCPAAGVDSSLSEQLSQSAHSQALKLELENRRLSSLLESAEERRAQEASARLAQLRTRAELERSCQQKQLELERQARLVRELERRLQKLSPDSSLTDSQKELRIANEQLRARELEAAKEAAEAEQLRREHAELKEDFGKLFRANESLLDEYRRAARELQRLPELQLQVSKLEHRLAVLEQLNSSLERDKRSLMQHIGQLFRQNHQLITQSLEDREHYHEEERKSNDQLNNLKRQKEKLEEKIMEQYRRQEPASGKKKSVGRSIVKSTFGKVRRAGSDLLNRSRRSWAEETRPADEPSFEFEFTRAHEPGESAEAAQRLARRHSTDFGPNNFSFDELCALYENDQEQDLDKTLLDSGNTELIMASTHDYSSFGKNKSVDLSFEKDENEEFHACQENEIIDANEHQSGQSIWLDQGCV